jgi:predicted AAA+ superfamily ATPase
VQSGKSSLFDLLINDLMQSAVDPKSILRLNLDEPVLTAYWDNPSDLYALIEASEVLTGVKVQYLFLDEVQQEKSGNYLPREHTIPNGLKRFTSPDLHPICWTTGLLLCCQAAILPMSYVLFPCVNDSRFPVSRTYSRFKHAGRKR